MKTATSLICLMVMVLSCDKKRAFDQYVELKPQSKWHKDSLMTFDFDITDTINKKDLFINIRNNHQYKFSNIFLIVKMTTPAQEMTIDTLEYVMAYPDGQFIGKKSSNIIENKLYYKKNYTFNQKGNYQMAIGQANRELLRAEGIEHLEGITEVGFRIENKN